MRALLQLARRLPARRCPSNTTTTDNCSMFLSRSIAAAAATPRLLRSRFSTCSTLRGGATTAAVVDSTDILEVDRSVLIQWEDGRTSHYDFTWLRVNCPSCLHESGQRTVFPGDVGADLKPTAISTEESRMSVTWSDGHVSTYKADWLSAHDNSPAALHQRSHGTWPTPLCAWDAIPKVDGPEYMESDEALYAALKKLNRTGVFLLENVGTEEGTVAGLTRRIAPVSHEMLYGQTFDVVSQKNPRNMAYTSEGLRLHMDLAYYESPPGLQLLHCVEFEDGVVGGESTFLDAFAAADHFRTHFPDQFEILARVPTTFHKVRAAAPRVEGEHRNVESLGLASMEYQRPLFQVDANGDLLTVTWAPMFEGVLTCSTRDVAPYYEAYRAFQSLIEEGPYAEDHTVRCRLRPGQCLVFNNRRLLHGREAFSMPEGGSRLLQGCYANADDALSRLCSLHGLQQGEEPLSGDTFDDPAYDQLKRVGNGSLPHVEY